MGLILRNLQIFRMTRRPGGGSALFLGVLSVLFQVASAQLPAQTPSYLHYEVQDGLPSNLVYCAYQDKLGLMWFGTNKGLASFDGVRFRVYGTKEGLPDPEVLGVWEDSKDRLWISSFRQQSCYRKEGQFRDAEHDTLLQKISKISPTFTFFEDHEGRIRFGGLRLQVPVTDGNNVWSEHYPSAIARFAYINNDLFALATSMVIRCFPDSQHVVHFIHPLPALYSGCSVSGNRLLYSLSDRLLLYEWKKEQLILLSEQIGKLSGQVFTDSKGRFWICSQKFGAVCFDNDRRDLSNPIAYLPGKKIMAMAEDSQGTLWFCTAGEGIFALPSHTSITFSKSEGLPSNNITALCLSRGNQLWFGDDEGDYYLLTNNHLIKNWKSGSNKGYNRCLQIFEDQNNCLWIVTDDHLLLCNSKKTEILLPSLSAFKSIFKQTDRVWYICFSHLGYILLDRPQQSIRLHHGRFTALGQDESYKLWVGRTDGLYCGPDSLSYNWGDHFPTLKTRIIAIETADSNHLWVVTPTSGLLWVQVQNGTVQKVDIVNDRLPKPIDNIQSIFRAADGQLWMATNHGVYGLSRDWKLQHFDHYNGLAADDVNAVVVQGDTLWAGTVAGLTRLVLSSSTGNGNFATLIAALNYRQSGELHHYNLLDSLVAARFTLLPPDARLIEFDLAALDYCSRGNLQFDYSLKPELLPWYYWTPSNLFNCINQFLSGKTETTRLENGTLNLGVQLNPGRYHLVVTAISSTGVSSNFPTEWTISMTPYWYQTIWAIIASWGLIGGATWRYMRTRAANRELGNEVSHLQLQTLQNQINPHFIGNSINAIQQFFYPFDSTRASRYITVFTRLLRKTMILSEAPFITFEDELSYVRDYMAMVKMRFGNQFYFEISGAENVPSDLLFPVMLLQPMLENATIHGLSPRGESSLSLDFQYMEHRLTCTILDNGIGIRAATSGKKRFTLKRKSKGLEIITQKVQALNQLYQMDIHFHITDRSNDEEPTNGTRVTISFLPIQNY